MSLWRRPAHVWPVLVAGLLSAWACQRPGGAPDGGKNAGITGVVVAPVESRDVPVILEGLGNATAFYTVVVRSQVDGRLDQLLFEEGQDVKRGQVLAQLDPRPFEIQVKQAEATLLRDQANLKSNQLKLSRTLSLREKNMVAQQDADDQQGVVDAMAATVQADEAQLAQARLQREYARVVAPISGRAGLRQADPGTLVHPNDPNGIVLITQLDPIAVLFSLPEDDLPELHRQASVAALPVEAYSRDGSLLLGRGKLTVIDNQINSSTGTLRLKAVMANPNQSLWPNQFVKVRVEMQTLSGVMVVPTNAVQYEGREAFVYVAGDDHKAHLRKLALAKTVGPWAVVSHGVHTKERVIVEGHQRLKEGTPIRVVEPARGGDGG